MSMKIKETFKKLMCSLLTLAMLIQYMPVALLRDVFAAGNVEARPISMSFVNNGTNLKPAGNGNFLLSIGDEMALEANLIPNWNPKEGYATGTKVTLKLPWFYYNENGIVVQTFNREEVIKENPDVQFIGGIEAKFTSSDATWYAANPPEDSADWGSDYKVNPDTGTKTGSYRRQTLEILSRNNYNLEIKAGFKFTFKFFTIDDHKIPENTTASIKLGANYTSFYDKDLKESSATGYVIEPGSLPSGNENKGDMRSINIVNSNLNWETSISNISMPVLWDKYNYAVYRVNIKNISEDANSKIDYFHFTMQVPNSVNNAGRGVLEQDMMAWKWDPATGKYIANDDISDSARENTFGGKYNQGGALIWDMTGKDTSNWDIAEDGAKNPTEFNYIYSMPGEIGVKINEDQGGALLKNQEKVYYVAVPYVNNFGNDYSHTVKLKQTIYFGGRDLAWSKDSDVTKSFIKQDVNFEHNKYVEKDNNKVNQKKSYLGHNETYYLDSFKNISNTPVFKSYAIDTLPADFNFNQVSIEMNGLDSKLKDWFFLADKAAESDPLEFISLKFLDENGAEKFVTLKELGASVVTRNNGSKNIWDIKDLDKKIEDYLKNHADYQFARDLKINFKDRIEVNDKIDGRIAITGKTNYLLEYENTLNTFYEKWNWVPYTTAETVPGYDKQLKQIKDPATAIIEGQRADPAIEGFGVYHDKDEDGNVTDIKNSSTNDSHEKYQAVSLADPDSAIRFELGTNNDSKMIPSNFEVNNLVQLNANKVYVGLVASSIYLSPTLLSSADIKSIDLYDANNTKITLSWEQLQKYINNADSSITIPVSAWQPDKGTQIVNLQRIVMNFNTFDGSVALNDGENAYIEVNGTPNATGVYRFEGTFTTQYNDYPAVAALGNITEDVKKATAILDVKRIKPTIEATANWDSKSSNNVNSPLIVPNKNSSLNPTNPTFYSFKVGNDSESSAQNVHLTIDLLSVKNVNDTMLKGFKTEKIIIKSGYDTAMDIDHIEFFDYGADPTKTPSMQISKDDLASYINSDGDIVIDLSGSSMTRIKTICIVADKFEKLIKDNDRTTIEVYGDTDSYNRYNDNNKLEASLLFEPIGPLYSDDDKKKESAAFSVQEGQLSVSNDLYQLDVKSATVALSSNTDGNEQTLGIPYARDFTYRVEFWNKGISILDDTDAFIEIPKATADGGFHATSVVIYEDLLKQYGIFNYFTFTTEDLQTVTMTYQPSTHTLIHGEKTYQLDANDCFVIPVEDISADQQLQSIMVTGKNFVINDGQDIHPYIEINGWSDSTIHSKNISKTTATHYLDGLRGIENTKYTVNSVDTANAYISKMYYDTTISAAYNDNNPSSRYSAISTPREHVRRRYPTNIDNSELEVGYKGLGSYLVDFRQYLNTGGNLPAGEGMYSQEHGSLNYIKPTSFNTAATVQMTVNLPKDNFDAYYLKIDERVKDYIDTIVVTRSDGTIYTLSGDEIKNNFKAVETGYGRINLLQKGENFADEQFFKDGEDNFYKEPTTNYQATNPIQKAVITLKINQTEKVLGDDGEYKANTPDYGTWWNESDIKSKYMFEFTGRFYKVGTARATVNSTVTIGNVDHKNDMHDSVVRQTTGTSGNPYGDSWSFFNYYQHNNGYSYRVDKYKANDLYSIGDVVVVRDFSRITKGATTNATNDYNRDAKIGDDNQYYINFSRASRTNQYGFLDQRDKYEAQAKDSEWIYQDPDDWQNKVGYADHVSINDTLGLIEPDETYMYHGTLTTGLDFHKQIANYMHEDKAVELVLGKGKTQAEQNSNKKTVIIKKSDLIKAGDYYTLKFDNSVDELSDDDAKDKTLELKDGTLYLEKNQYVLSFRALLWDIQGNGEYTSELGDSHYNYVDDDGITHQGVDSLNNVNDIIVRVKPFMVYENNTTKIQQATNTATTKTYEDRDLNTGYDSYMFNDSTYGSWTYDKAYIMGYRIPFKAGHNLVAMGKTPIDTKDDVVADGKTAITDYLTQDGSTYTKLDGSTYQQIENETPTNTQFGVKLYNQTVANPTDRSIPARIKKVVTDDKMNEFYRLRNLYIPTQWIYQEGDIVNPTDKGRWFKMSQIQVTINGKVLLLKPSADGLSLEVTGPNLLVKSIPLNTIKKVNGQDCYVINIENFARQNYQALVVEQNGMAKANVTAFKITLESTNPDFKDDETVLCNGEYLTASKNNDGYAYFYDGVYVERSIIDFNADSWTKKSVPTFGQVGNEYSPYSSNGSNTVSTRRDVYNRIEDNGTNSLVFTSIDNNADTYSDVTGSTKLDEYNLRNAVAILEPKLTKKRGTNDELFAYDKAEKTEHPGDQTEIDFNHLMPYDYVDYTLSSQANSNSEIPLERNHLSLVVEKGQQIVGWELIPNDDPDHEDIIDSQTGLPITAADISVTLSNDTDTLDNALSQKDYSLTTDEKDTHYRKIELVVGHEGTQIQPGQKIKVRIITQMTDELKTATTTFEDQTVDANAYIYAEPLHGFGQYAINGYDSSLYSTGGTSSNGWDLGNKNPNPYTKIDDINTNDKISYFRYQKNTTGKYSTDKEQYNVRMQNTLKFYDNTPVDIEYKFDRTDRLFEGQGAKLTVSKITNDTMHFVDEQTVTVDFLDKKGFRGFTLTKMPTVSFTKAENGDIYYPDDLVQKVGEVNMKNIRVQYTLADLNNRKEENWVTVDYGSLPDANTMKLITAIRWTYFDVYSGYDQTSSPYKTKIEFDDVVLVGEGKYEDIREDSAKTKVMDDTYLSVSTAFIDHYQKHVENKSVIVDNTENNYEVVRNVTLNDVNLKEESVYREVPQVILHPQVFDSQSDASANYDENAQQKIGYRPEESYWQKITLINREMIDAKDVQNARQGRLFNPTIYDKIPSDYVSVQSGTLQFKWLDEFGTPVAGNYTIKETKIRDEELADYGGNMVYEKSKSISQTQWKSVDGGKEIGAKAFDDLLIDDAHTLQTKYTVKTYTIIDNATGDPITMNIGDTLIIYYQLKIAKDNLPMVYVDEDKDLDTTDDQHPAYFPRAGEYYQIQESYNNSAYRNGQAYPFSANYSDDANHWRAITNSDKQMDMDYLLHDIGVTADLNEFVDKWEFLKDSYVYIPGDGSVDSLANARYGGGNGTLGDYDISSTRNMMKTVYTPGTTDPNGDGKDHLPERDKSSMTIPNKTATNNNRDWYEKVIEPRVLVYDNWGSTTPIIWAQNRIHLQKAWLVSASEFVTEDPDTDNRQYEITNGDRLTDNRVSNPNYQILPNISSSNNSQKNQLHSYTDDNYEVGLEYNQRFNTKLQALNYGDWDLSGGVEFTYTMPRGIEPEIFDADGNIDLNKLKVEILKSVDGADNKSVKETYNSLTLDAHNFEIEVLQKPSDGHYSYQAPTQSQDPQMQSTQKEDYPTGSDTSPWVLKIIVKENLKKWFNRGTNAGYKLNVSIPSHVYSTNDSEEWFDRLQTKPYVANDTYKDHYYYQILDIDHWEGTTRENMQHNQRYGMDYMWYRGDGSGRSYYYSNGQYYYYNGSMNMPYINGYNIQNQEVVIKEENGIKKGVALENNYNNYSKADTNDRYSQTGTRAIMRKPLLRQWTTVGDDKTGKTLSDYYIDSEGANTKFNIHVENKYWLDELGTDHTVDYTGSTDTDGTKEAHSYATDGGARGTYNLPVITNILPYGIAPVGTKQVNGSDTTSIFSIKDQENQGRTLNWELLDIDGSPLGANEKDLYDVDISYEYIARLDDDGNPIIKDGEEVTEGRYVVRFYAKADSDAGDSTKEAKILSGQGRTFSFETFTYASPKLDTLNEKQNDGLGDTFESNYTYISSKMDNFKALIDEDINEKHNSMVNNYTVGHTSYDRYKYNNSNSYFKPDTRHDAIVVTRTQNNTTVNYGKIPNNILTDKITGDNHYVIGQGMERVYENVREKDGNLLYNIEDYRYQSSTGDKIRNALVLGFEKANDGSIIKNQTDFNLNQDEVHYDYAASTQPIGDVAFMNTIKVRTRRPNLTIENFVGSTSDEVGKKTATLDATNHENVPGSTAYTYDHDNDPATSEIKKNFDYGDEVWYTAKLTNKAADNDYAKQGSIYHSRFVFSYHLPDIITAVDNEKWDEWKTKDFVIELRDEHGNIKQQITPDNLKDSGWAIRVINKGYQDQNDGQASPQNAHTGQIITFELIPAADPDFSDYDSYVQGHKPAGHLAYGDSLTLKIRTRIDNKEFDGIDPTDASNPDVWTGYYSEVYSTIHTTDGEYIMTDKGHIYNDDERDQIQNENIIYDGYTFNQDIYNNYGKTFTLQPQALVDWHDKEISDEKNIDGSLKNDYDRDGEFDDAYAYASSASIQVLKPEASNRIDTSHLRKRVSDDNASIVVIDDAHVRSADVMKIRLTQAVNEQANVNEFVASLNIPHRGTNTATSQVAGIDAKPMTSQLQEIRSGNWEIPDNYQNKDIYDAHLKVYVYGLIVDDPWKMTGYVNPDYEDPDKHAEWSLLGKANGYKLADNSLITEDEINDAIDAYKATHSQANNANVYQLKWVVRMEGFTYTNPDTSITETYSAKDAAINYPVPVGLRLAIDADGVKDKEINESDPKENNTEETIMQNTGVVDNCAYVSVITGSRDVSDGITKHVNYFVNTYAKYDDHKYTAISKTNRAGFYIDPELPTLEINLEQGYYKPTVEDKDGENRVHFVWDYNNSTIDDVSSKMLKYRATMKNKKVDESKNILIQDNATSPNITIALPYNENLDTSKLKYIAYDPTNADNYLDDHYQSYDQSLDKKIPLWTWYIVNEDGDVVENTSVKAIKISDDSPVVTSKELTANRKEKSKILNFYFTGELRPGEDLKVEVMVPIQRMNSNAISAELLRCKAYIFKNGAFNAYTPDQGSMDSSAYEYDSQDINENGYFNDTAITKMTTSISFNTIQSLGQTKLVDTELENNVTNVPASVNEGGDYTFKISSASLSATANYKYTKNILYDVLPYLDDKYVYQTRKDGDDYVTSNRNSKWNGWINLDSLVVTKFEAGKDQEVLNKNQYSLWVGPIVKKADGKYVLNNTSDNKPIIPSALDIRDDTKLQSLITSNSEKSKYFVKLDELQAYLNTVSVDEKEELVKGIKAVWLQMNDSYTIQPSSRLELSYSMHAPQNVTKHVGTVQVVDDETTDSATQLIESVKHLTGWNTFLSRAYSEANLNFEMLEETVAGVYVNAPTDRGYLGSYIWQDVDFNGKIDEGTYEDTYGIGRDLLKTPKYDLNNDSIPDDPGVNGVLVELLSPNGHPVNKEGEAIAKESDFNGGTDTGKYIILDDVTGQPIVLDPGTDKERYRYSSSKPATYVSESDYYGNKGYFVFSNLKPGKYNLRYTLPKEYVDYSITTKELNKAVNNKVGVDVNTPVIIYRNGEVVYNENKDLTDTSKSNAQKAAYKVSADTLVVQTSESIEVKPVDEDQSSKDAAGMTAHERYDRLAMGYSLGIGRTNLYKGTTWLDETYQDPNDEDSDVTIDGKMQDQNGFSEKRLGDIKVEVFEVDPTTQQPISQTPTITADGQLASYKTSDQVQGHLKPGEYEFRLVPGKSYIVKATNLDKNLPLKPTAPVYSNDPSSDTKFNDLYLDKKLSITHTFDVPYITDDHVDEWKDYDKTHTIDLGFVKSSRGFIGELVWDDENYNGIQDSGEKVFENTQVTLESYYYDTDSHQWVKLPDEKTTKTNAGGAYQFTVSTFYSDKDDSTKGPYIKGYKVRIDQDKNPDLFKKYAPTWQGITDNGKQSDMTELPNNQNRYYLTSDYVIIAKDNSDETLPEHVVDMEGKKYDIGNAETKNYDAGLKAYETGDLDGIVWLDDNYDGIRDNNEAVQDSSQLTPAEELLSHVKVHIKGYYYDGTWKEATWSVADSALTLGSDQYYHYSFKDLPTSIMVGGKAYLMGYRLTLDANSIDESLKPTLRYQGQTNLDSHLEKTDDGIYNLNKQNEYIITANEAKKHPDNSALHDLTVTIGEKTYDILQHQDIKSYDAGLSNTEPGEIQGYVWLDYNYDGIKNDTLPHDHDMDDAILKDITLEVKQYIVSEVDGEKVYTENTSFPKTTVKTDQDGLYSFKKLPAYYVDAQGKYHIYAYQVILDPEDNKSFMETQDYQLGITKQHRGDDIQKDSDWSNNGTLLHNEADYLILLNKVTDKTPAENKVLGYDIVKGRAYSNVNAGAAVYQKGYIQGIIFDDQDYDGLYNAQEDVLYPNVNVTLKQYYINTQGDYIETGKTETTKTDAKGEYVFKNLDTHGVDAHGDKHIYAYQISLESLPEKYAVTKYHMGTADDSYNHIYPKDSIFKEKDNDNQYIILAKHTDDTSLAQYFNGYDLIESLHKDSFDGGITKFNPGSISGYIFDDLDYDGIFNNEDHGQKDVNVMLTQYAKVEGSHDYIPTGAVDSVTTDDNGYYKFKDLPTCGLNDENKMVLYAYRILVREETLPNNYGITKYREKDNDCNSKLKSDSYELISNEQYHFPNSQEPYIILANQTDDHDISYYQEGYDLIESVHVTELNGGITKFNPGSISGYIFDDLDYDGIFNNEDHGQKDVNVMLTQYAKVKGSHDYIPTGAVDSVMTDANGYYQFKDLPTSGLNDENEMVLYAYRVVVQKETLPDNYGITKYRVSDDEHNSKLKSDSYELMSNEENQFPDSQEPYIILANHTDNQNISYNQEGYDLIESVHVTQLNGGISQIQLGKISGQLFVDGDYDGLFNNIDTGKEGIKVILKQYIQNDETKEYEETGVHLETVTSTDGEYHFDQLKTHGVNEQGDVVIYSYRVYVDLDSIPKDYAVTQYQIEDDHYPHSNLIADTGLLYGENEYIVLVQQSDDQNIQTQHNSYDLIQVHNIDSLDGGITPYGLGKITGTVWMDSSQDGIKDALEPGIKSCDLTLQRYYYKDNQWIEDTQFNKSATSDDKGNYEFNNLKSYVEIEDQKYLAGYQVYALEAPQGTNVTKYLQNQGNNDNKLQETDLRMKYPKFEKDDYVIIADTNYTKNLNSQTYNKYGYNIIKARHIDDMNAGFYGYDKIVIVTADDTTLFGYCLLIVSSLAIGIVLLKKRKED